MKLLKKLFNKNTLKIVWITYALLSILVIVLFSDHLLTNNLNKGKGKLILDKNWNITINSDTYENVTLSDFKFPAVDKGTSILMETTLPSEWEFDNPALTFHIRQTTAKMYINWELFYEYGHNRLYEGETVGSGLQIINFPQGSEGSNLKILLTVTEDNVFTSFDPVYLTEWEDSYKYIITENRLALYTGAFLVILGIVVSAITIFATIYSKKYASMLWLSAFSIFIGLWTLCYHNIFIIFSIPTYSISLLEYMTLMMAPIPILGYIFDYVKATNNKTIFRIYSLLFIIQIILSIITIAFHSTDIAHSAALLPYSQTLFVLHAIFFTIIFFMNRKVTAKRKILYNIGLVIILFCIVYDLVMYLVNRYTGLQIPVLKGVCSLGIIVFIGILIMDMIHNISLNMIEEHEKERLIKHAYTDELTQINNRTFCAEYMLALESKKSNNYTIFNFDLDNLKIVNDSYGHAQGDLLIKKAASVISKVFGGSGIVGRMGGDEFIAIIPSDNVSQIELLIRNFSDAIKKVNEEDPFLHLSISFGYATNTELNDVSLEQVYQLADKRMYMNKTQSKHR